MAKVLVIDDDELLRMTLVRALIRAGHSVSEAANGRDGLRMFQKNSADLIVTDLIMPEREGIETIREIRETARSLPIIAISGGLRGSSMDILGIAARLGATRVIAKPFELGAFLSEVEAALTMSSSNTL